MITGARLEFRKWGGAIGIVTRSDGSERRYGLPYEKFTKPVDIDVLDARIATEQRMIDRIAFLSRMLRQGRLAQVRTNVTQSQDEIHLTV